MPAKFAIFAACLLGMLCSAPGTTLWAQDTKQPAIAPQPRTINLTQEQRYIIKENLKDSHLPKAPAHTPEAIGDAVPQDIELYPMPPLVAEKVPQVKSHKFFINGGDNAIVLVSPEDRRVADVIR